MHELGIVYEMVNQVEKVVEENKLTTVKSLTVQIGKLSSVVPEYLEKCYPAAVDGTIMENTELIIELLPANAVCEDCNTVFDVVDNKRECPKCGSRWYEILSGKEVMIKQIEAC